MSQDWGVLGRGWIVVEMDTGLHLNLSWAFLDEVNERSVETVVHSVNAVLDTSMVAVEVVGEGVDSNGFLDILAMGHHRELGTAIDD